jgi:hypothetical protein
MMSAMRASDQGTSFSAVRAQCPMFPASTVSWEHGPQLLPGISQVFYAAILSHPVVHAQVDSLYRVAWGRSQQKRGPPILI